jgi:hypothetical protein
MPVTSLNAKTKLFLDTQEVDFSNSTLSSYSYEHEIKYPEEYDTLNRRGQDWHVLDIDLESRYRCLPLL